MLSELIDISFSHSCVTQYLSIFGKFVSMFSNKNELHCQYCNAVCCCIWWSWWWCQVIFFFSRTKSLHSVIGSQISTTITFISIGYNYCSLHISESIFFYVEIIINYYCSLSIQPTKQPFNHSSQVKWTSERLLCMCVASFNNTQYTHTQSVYWIFWTDEKWCD